MALLVGSINNINIIEKHRICQIRPLDSNWIIKFWFNIYLIQMNKEIALPAFACYKPQCQHSSYSWIAYQSSTAEIRLVEFNIDNVIKESLTINISSQPLKAIRITYSPEEKTVYVGLALLSKYIILKKNQVVTQYTLPLYCNIADFDAGFVALDAVNDGYQIYFVFATSKGQIMTVPVLTPEKCTSFNVDVGSRITSLCTKQSYAYLGTEGGMVFRVDMNSKKVIEKYNTISNFPLFNLKIVNDFLVLGTCQGQLHLVDLDLKAGKVISAHEGMITMIVANKQKIYTVGDDLTLRSWLLKKQATLDSINNQFFKQKPNMLFTLYNKTYLAFYQESSFFQV